MEQEETRVPISIEKSTLTIGVVCSIVSLAIGMTGGLAFSFGTKNASLDNLSIKVEKMSTSLDTLAHQMAENDKTNSIDINQLKFEYQDLSKKIDGIMNRLDYDEAAGKKH